MHLFSQWECTFESFVMYAKSKGLTQNWEALWQQFRLSWGPGVQDNEHAYFKTIIGVKDNEEVRLKRLASLCCALFCVANGMCIHL
jgi:hypothetical protein